ncbi:MAG: 50S ribosomal protein L29 [Candidatus Omnitrophota bacterium]
MAKTKISEIRNLGLDELADKTGKLRKELMQLRFQAKTGKLEKQSAMKQTKKEIARCMTVMNEKRREAAVSEEKSHAGRK